MSVLQFAGVTKQYGALRPLRIERLDVAAGERVALIGLDQPAAEVFISLATGGALPDSGSISAFGAPTTDITDSQAWLTSLDRFGIVSDRAAIVDMLSVVQNLAIPFSLDIEPPPPEIREQAVGLAREARVSEAVWDRAVGELGAADRMRVKLARALAFRPELLLIEHPTATLERAEVPQFAADIRAAAEGRGLATVVLTMDEQLAEGLGGRVLTLQPATGALTEKRRKGFRFW